MRFKIFLLVVPCFISGRVGAEQTITELLTVSCDTAIKTDTFIAGTVCETYKMNIHVRANPASKWVLDFDSWDRIKALHSSPLPTPELKMIDGLELLPKPKYNSIVRPNILPFATGGDAYVGPEPFSYTFSTGEYPGICQKGFVPPTIFKRTDNDTFRCHVGANFENGPVMFIFDFFPKEDNFPNGHYSRNQRAIVYIQFFLNNFFN